MSFKLTQESLFEIIVSVVHYLKVILSYFFGEQNYRIKNARILYSREHYSDYEDITYEYRKDGTKTVMSELSKNVLAYMFEVTYRCNGKTYILLSSNPDHAFPPQKPKPSFRLPVKEAILLDEYDVPLLNVTEDFKMYEGPYTDFHGETIRLKAMVDGHKIRLVSVLGNTVDYVVETDSISHQTIWSPGKT